jgi:hypothetical protein
MFIFLTLLVLLIATPSFAAAVPSRLCEGAASVAACHSHMAYLVYLARHPAVDTSPAYMKAKDPRYNNAMIVGGGGGAGGSGGDGGGAAGAGP